MMKICSLCSQFQECVNTTLCADCYASLEKISTQQSAVCSIFSYNSALRSLILNVKVRGNQSSYLCLRELFLQNTLVQDLGRGARVITPVSSSLWSRLRGRFDLAYLLARSLAKTYRVPLELAPLRTRWSLQKRSKTLHRSLLASFLEAESTPQNYRLIVDDVVRSGYTLHRTASPFADTHHRFLTLASALD